MKLISAVLYVALLWRRCMSAQGLDPALIGKPPADMWPTYNGDYSGRRYSALKQINSTNIKSITLGWAFEAKSVNIKSTPLLVNGVLYFTVPDNVYAIDARTGRHIWHYQYPPNQGDHIEAARRRHVRKEWLYFELRRMRTWSASMPKTAKCAGTSFSPTKKWATSRPWRPWWCAIT